MNKRDVGHVVQMLANIGVVASIVLLAMQLQQNNKIMAASVEAVRVAQETQVWGAVVDQPEIAELLIKDRQGDTLAPVEELRLDALWVRNLYNVQYVFRDTEDRSWVPALRRAFEGYRSLRTLWNGGGKGSVIAQKDQFYPEFVKFVDQNVYKEPAIVITDTPAPTSKVSTR